VGILWLPTSVKSNICKHQIVVLLKLWPNLPLGIIVSSCKACLETTASGLEALNDLPSHPLNIKATITCLLTPRLGRTPGLNRLEPYVPSTPLSPSLVCQWNLKSDHYSFSCCGTEWLLVIPIFCKIQVYSKENWIFKGPIGG
jgi:hypothetical protein